MRYRSGTLWWSPRGQPAPSDTPYPSCIFFTSPGGHDDRAPPVQPLTSTAVAWREPQRLCTWCFCSTKDRAEELRVLPALHNRRPVLLAHPNHSHHQQSEPLALTGANRAPPALCKRTMRTRILSASAHAAHCQHCMAGRQGPTDAGHTELSNAGKAGCAFGRAPATHPMRPVSSCLVSQLSWSQG